MFHFSLLYIYGVTTGMAGPGLGAIGTTPTLMVAHGRGRGWTEHCYKGGDKATEEHRVPLIHRGEVHFNLGF